jgi:hypothetical protein
VDELKPFTLLHAQIALEFSGDRAIVRLLSGNKANPCGSRLPYRRGEQIIFSSVGKEKPVLRNAHYSAAILKHNVELSDGTDGVSPPAAYEICRNIMEAQVPIDRVYVLR